MKNRPRFRFNKLIKPRMQLRMVLVFAGIATIALLMQYLLMQALMIEMASSMPSGGEYVLDRLPETLRQVLFLSFGVLLPLTLAVGVLVTFRVAGPVYRFEQYLAQIAGGEPVGECRIREDDELQDLCEAINRATAGLRAVDEANARNAATAAAATDEQRACA